MYVPPLSQSKFETLRCPTSYVAQVIEGKRTPESIASDRGSEIHRILARYAEHCASVRRGADWTFFDEIVEAVCPEAAPILDNIRDNWTMDFQHIYQTEIRLRLDEDLNPTILEEQPDGSVVSSEEDALNTGIAYSDEPAAHAGTLDVLLLEDDQTAIVDDYKSHPQAFDPTTYQAMLYPYMVLKHFPEVRRVLFRLKFARFAKLERVTDWTREDMPEMESRLRQARAVQKRVHRDYVLDKERQVIAHSGCQYCPLAANLSCPMGEFNPQIAVSIEKRANFNRWATFVSKQNTEVMKNRVQATGVPIRVTDGVGDVWEYGAQEMAKRVYPLDQTLIQILDGYSEASGEDWGKMKLAVSSTTLRPKLDTKKRAALKDVIEESHLEMKPGLKYTFAKLNNDGSRDIDPDQYNYEE